MEPPGASMARWLREAIQDSAAVPECVSGYKWLWVAASAGYCEIGTELPHRIERPAPIMVGDIKLNVCVGLDHDLGVAVLFWGKGGPNPVLPRDRHLIDELSAEGVRFLRLRTKNRLKGVQWKDQTDPGDEGEGWKKGYGL